MYGYKTIVARSGDEITYYDESIRKTFTYKITQVDDGDISEFAKGITGEYVKRGEYLTEKKYIRLIPNNANGNKTVATATFLDGLFRSSISFKCL